MRVAMLGPYPLDDQRLMGGVEAAMVHLSRELAKRPDVDLHIVTCSQKVPEPQTTQREGFTVIRLPRGRMGRVTWHLRETKAFNAILRNLEPDVVHAHTSGLYAGAALASPYPAVITVHGIVAEEAKLLTGWRDELRGFLDTQYERWVIRRAKHLIAITPYVRDVFDGVFDGRSYLVENPCDERFFAVGRDPVPGTILFTGVVIPRKGVLPLLKAFRLLRQRTTPDLSATQLRIAGSTQVHPEYYAACRDYVRENDLEEAVTFLGHLAPERVLEEYARCATLVLPAFQETAPIVVAEAMAAGVPLVATRAGGVPWMVEDGVTGVTLPLPSLPEGDHQTLARALAQVFHDPVEARAMGRRAQAEARKRFHPRTVACRTYEVYEQVIQEGA
jgi:glycosyltransferase involved in cell wall biosynthesis